MPPRILLTREASLRSAPPREVAAATTKECSILETRESGVLYHQSRDGTSAKQVRVAEAGPERNLRKALLRGVLRPAQLPAEERNASARAMQSMRSRTAV